MLDKISENAMGRVEMKDFFNVLNLRQSFYWMSQDIVLVFVFLSHCSRRWTKPKVMCPPLADSMSFWTPCPQEAEMLRIFQLQFLAQGRMSHFQLVCVSCDRWCKKTVYRGILRGCKCAMSPHVPDRSICQILLKV